MNSLNVQTRERICYLNDLFRTTFNRAHGQVFISANVVALPRALVEEVMHTVQLFSAFDEDDYEGLHETAYFSVAGELYVFEVGYIYTQDDGRDEMQKRTDPMESFRTFYISEADDVSPFFAWRH